ncbi:UPF0182 family protein [Neosynechococcus sphagnicola]|uniref:UPF0182 family protein n=1 Tax=Neosynechococcus sphagnicola TaxID=1501145 RepID=UPI0006913D91|nr:UPF0182 family protein [Neosynechococcus sphagnicola]
MSLKSSRWVRLAIALPLVLLAGDLLLDWAVLLWIDSTWFTELGYFQAWRIGWLAPWIVWLVVWVLLLPVIGIPIHLAWVGEKQGWRRGIVLLFSAGMAGLAATQWFTILTWLNQVPVGTTEPVFGHDIGFYLFSLPMWQFLQGWSLGLGVLIFGLVGVIYYRRSTLLAMLPAIPVLMAAQRHLLFLGGGLFLLLAWGHWLSRYSLLYSTRGSFAGANYTDIQFQLPANTFLVGVCIVSAIACGWLSMRKPNLVVVKTATGDSLQWDWRRLSPLLVLLAGYGLSSFLVGGVLPAAVQKLIVLPNELERDRPYIEKNY